MKRIVISAFGSFGDLHPYFAIALELKRRGHHPIIATSEIYREKADALGLELYPVRPDLPSSEQPEEIERMVVEFMDKKNGTVRILGWLVSHLREAYDDLMSASSGSDLLLTHPLPFVGPLVAEKTGIPWASSVLSPMSFFSSFDPVVPPQIPVLYNVLKLSSTVARGFGSLARWRIKSLFAPVERLRAELGLRRSTHVLFEDQHSPKLVLALFSSVLAKPQPDWPPNTRVTGFCFYDRRDRAGDAPGMEPRLVEFLNQGPPPIVFTLGSTAFWVAQNFYRDSIAAARALGRRALLLIGAERNRPSGPLPEGVAAFEYAPFGDLLSRGCATVHHGGIGSTGQALRAGKPSLVVPFSHDQFDNGVRVSRRGFGRMLPHEKYSASTAERELRTLLTQPSYGHASESASLMIQNENGPVAACDAIEEMLSR